MFSISGVILAIGKHKQVIKCVILATVNDLTLQVAPSSNNKCAEYIMDTRFTNEMYGNFI